MTRARSSEDAILQLAALRELCKLSLPVFVADAGSIPEFVNGLKDVPGVQLRVEGENLVQQVKGSIHRAIAGGHRFILYTEPDKKQFFEHGARTFIADALRKKAAVCMAARDEQSFATFPGGQQSTEAAFNSLASFFLGSLPDQLYGPLILDAHAVSAFITHAPDELGWGWRTYVIARAARAQLMVTAHVGRFPCPLAQRIEDDEVSRLYRLQQLNENIDGLRLGLKDAMSS